MADTSNSYRTNKLNTVIELMFSNVGSVVGLYNHINWLYLQEGLVSELLLLLQSENVELDKTSRAALK